jgi:endonuclease-3
LEKQIIAEQSAGKREQMKPQRKEPGKERAREIAGRLARVCPKVIVPLFHRSAFELLVATILSAQCTDEAVNRVTPRLFSLYPDPTALARAPLKTIEETIRRLGLFRSKARALKEASRQLVEKHGGDVPSTMSELTRMKGVGRKTANVILGHAFGIPGVVVDTHVKRVARRLGLTRENDPDRIERDLMALVPESEWISFSYRLLIHGRKTCHARKPRCRECILSDLCPSVAMAL